VYFSHCTKDCLAEYFAKIFAIFLAFLNENTHIGLLMDLRVPSLLSVGSMGLMARDRIAKHNRSHKQGHKLVCE
jgi:hypothetical protein